MIQRLGREDGSGRYAARCQDCEPVRWYRRASHRSASRDARAPWLLLLSRLGRLIGAWATFSTFTAGAAAGQAGGNACTQTCVNPPPAMKLTNFPTGVTTTPSASPIVWIQAPFAADTVFLNGVIQSWPLHLNQTTGWDSGQKTIAFTVGRNTLAIDGCSGPGNGNKGSCGTLGRTVYYDNVQIGPKNLVASGGVNYDTSQVFTITNYGASPGTFTLTTTCNGLSSCVNKLGSSVIINGNSSIPDTVTFTTGAQGSSGTVEVKVVYSNPAGLDSATVTVNAQWPSLFTLNTAYTNQEDQNGGRCANACFAAVAALATVPYYSKDVPRSVALVYNGDRLAPRPIVMADVTVNPAPYTITDLLLQVQLNNGTWVRFTNGQDTLHFAPSALVAHPGTPYRIAGQFDDSVLAYSNASVPMKIVVTAIFADNQGTFSGVQQIVDSTHFLSVNRTWTAGYPRGWTAAAYSRLYYEQSGADTYMAAGEGDGSVRIYGPINSTCASGVRCVWNPVSPGATDTLVWNNPASILERHFIDGSKWIYNLNPPGPMIQLRISPLGDTTYFGYQSGTVLLDTITDPYRLHNGKHTYTLLKYNSAGVLDSIVEPGPYPGNVPGAGRVTTLTVNSTDGTLTAWTDPDGISTRFTYDVAHRLTAMVNRRGDTTKYAYAQDSSWKLASVTSPAIPIDSASTGTATLRSAVTLSRAWQTSGLAYTPTSQTSQFAPVLTSAATATVTDPEHQTSTFTADPWGQPLVTVDALGDTTTVTRDGAGYPRTIAYPNGGHDQFVYTNGLLTFKQSAGGQPVTYTYGPLNRLSTITGPHRPTVTYTINPTTGRISVRKINSDTATVRLRYDALQRVDTIIDRAGHATYFAYDPVTGNRSNVSGSFSGQTVAKQFDGYGRDSLVVTGANPAVTVLYDVLNRPVKVYDGIHSAPTTTYYDAVNVDSVTDTKGQTFRTVHDAVGRVSASVDPRGDTAKVTYTANGYQATVRNRRGNLLTFRYDALGRLVAKHDPVAGDSATFAYSVKPNAVVSVAVNALETDSAYADSTGWTDSVKTFIGLTNKTYTQHYKQTDRHQLDSVWVTGSPLTFTWANTRFAWDTLTAMRDSTFINGNGIRHHYTVEYLRDSTIFPGGVVRIDSVGAMETHQRTATRYSVQSLDTAFFRAYSYDGSGRVIEQDRHNAATTFVQQFQFDGLGELTWDGMFTANTGWVCQPNKSCRQNSGLTETDGVTVSYDSAGNIRQSADSLLGTTTAQNTTGNRDSTWGTIGYLYDADGNRTSRSGQGGTVTYAWSADGRLLSVTAGSHVLSYGYNATGQLIRRSINGAVRGYFLWDRGNLRAELDSTGANRINEYVYAFTLDHPLARITGSGTGTIHYYQQDALGNIMGQFSGTTLEQDLRYGPWGGLTAVGTTTGDTTRLRWKGLYWEGDSTQLYYVRARWYDPVNHRFVSEDPLGAGGGGLNFYTFAGGDPVNGSDASGAFMDVGGGCDPGNDDSCQGDGSDVGTGGGGGTDTGAEPAGSSNGADANCNADASQCGPSTDTPNAGGADGSDGGATSNPCGGDFSDTNCSTLLQAIGRLLVSPNAQCQLFGIDAAARISSNANHPSGQDGPAPLIAFETGTGGAYGRYYPPYNGNSGRLVLYNRAFVNINGPPPSVDNVTFVVAHEEGHVFGAVDDATANDQANHCVPGADPNGYDANGNPM